MLIAGRAESAGCGAIGETVGTTAGTLGAKGARLSVVGSTGTETAGWATMSLDALGGSDAVPGAE